MFYNRVVLPRFMGKSGDEEAARTAETQELPPMLDYLETVVPDAGEFLVGGRITLADIAVASQFVNFDHLRCARDAARHSRVYAYVDAILSRPRFGRWRARGRGMLAHQRA